MRILFFISVHGHGSGGHFYSLDHISRKIGEKNEIRIVTVGLGHSRIISQNPYFEAQLFFNGYNVFLLRRKLNEIIGKYKPEIYHFFDNDCYNVIRILCYSRNYKMVLNKCGGPNFKQFPSIKNLIVFSKENYRWFKSKQKFEQSSVYHIPNRVEALKLDPEYHPIPRDNSKFTFIRICRIGFKYKKSIIDSINLIDYLHSIGLTNTKLYIIGVVTDIEVLEEVSNIPLVKDKHVVVLTDVEFTFGASKILYLADAVIGTGRGLMEAASLAKPLLAINARGNIPVLLDSATFDYAFTTNFSERNEFIGQNENVNKNKVQDLILNKEYYEEISGYSKYLFNEYFDISKVIKLYTEVYRNAESGSRYLLYDTILILKSFLRFYRNYLRNQKK